MSDRGSTDYLAVNSCEQICGGHDAIRQIGTLPLFLPGAEIVRPAHIGFKTQCKRKAIALGQFEMRGADNFFVRFLQRARRRIRALCRAPQRRTSPESGSSASTGRRSKPVPARRWWRRCLRGYQRVRRGALFGLSASRRRSGGARSCTERSGLTAPAGNPILPAAPHLTVSGVGRWRGCRCESAR